MGTTLARRIRRISLLPATFAETIEERAGKDESGSPCIHKIAREVLQRNVLRLTEVERSCIARVIREEARAKRQRKAA